MMEFESPLSKLADVIETIRDRASRFHSQLSKNEAATRAALIDPLLQALGWDTSNIEMVEVEKTFGAQARIDYVLFDHIGGHRIGIEAKPLGSPLATNNQIQLAKNGLTAGVGEIISTDGIEWQFFSNFSLSGVAPTLAISFVKDDPIYCALHLIEKIDASHFWPRSQSVSQIASEVATLSKLVDNLQAQLASYTSQSNALVPKSSAPTKVTQKKPTVNSQNLGLFVALNQIGLTTGTKPSRVRLPDGSIHVTLTWKLVLEEFVKFALATNPSVPVPLSDKAGKKLCLLLLNPTQGGTFSQLQLNGTTIYLYTNYSANDIVRNSLHILDVANVPIGQAAIELL